MVAVVEETVSKDEVQLFTELDKGIDDMEAGRLTPHEDTIKEVKERLREYVLNSGNR